MENTRKKEICNDDIGSKTQSVLYGVEDVPSPPVCFLIGLQVKRFYKPFRVLFMWYEALGMTCHILFIVHITVISYLQSHIFEL